MMHLPHHANSLHDTPHNNSKHEVKKCPRCGRPFTCKMNNIVHCHCSQIQMPKGMPEWVKERYDDCLCHACLQTLAEGRQ